MERLVLKQFEDWKQREDRKPLIVNGARQVGKTWLLKTFANRFYKKNAYILCRKNEDVRQIFQSDFDIKRIILALSAMVNVDITAGDTLIIFDEVQDIPEIIESLKYFYEQAPEYHVAVAGSLLGVSLHPDISFPVGKVSMIDVYPMNFQEFLLALGEQQAFRLLQDGDFETASYLHDKFIDLLRLYYYVGGMPEVVAKYVKTGALKEVRRLQNEILKGYERDFSKHAPTEQVPRIRMVWNSIPSQLFKENKKYIYGALRKGARFKDFEMAIEWLIDAGLLYKVPRCNKVEQPLSIYEDLSAFKLYMLDLGLMGAMANIASVLIVVKNDAIKEYKGGYTEQYVMQQMKSKGVDPIYYHKTDDSRLEIDFLIQDEEAMVPIEVKAESNVKANSLSKLLSENPSLHALRYSMLPYKVQGQMTNIPLYAV